MDVPGIGESHGISWWSCCFMLEKSPFLALICWGMLAQITSKHVQGFKKKQWGMAPNQMVDEKNNFRHVLMLMATLEPNFWTKSLFFGVQVEECES